MKFNPASNEDSIIADIDFLLFGDSSTLNTSYSLIDRTRNINIVYDEVVAELFEADPNFMWDDTTNPDFPIATIALEANKDHYTLPDGSLRINRVRMMNNAGVFVTLTPKQRRELSDDELNSTGSPVSYYKIDNAVFPLPVPDYGYSGGVEIEFQRGSNHFASTDTDTSPGFASIFHQALSIGAALRYAMSKGMKEKVAYLSNERERIRTMIAEHYRNRSPDQKPRIRLKARSTANYGL
jgi:hypothetical protein